MKDIIRIWLVDKFFLPPPAISKNRYKIFFHLPNVALTVFSSRFSEYGRLKYKMLPDEYKNSKWMYLPAIKTSSWLLYISFSVSFFIKALFEIIRSKNKPDLLIASCPDPFQAIATLFIAKIANVPFVVDFRDYWPELLIEIGVMGEKSFPSKFIYFLTTILAKYAKGIMAAEDTYLKRYLAKRSVDMDKKKIFIRENIYIEYGNEWLSGTSEIGLEIIKQIKEFKKKYNFVFLITGRQNIEWSDIKVIREFVNNLSLKAAIIILSNDTKIQTAIENLGPFVKLFEPVDRNSYMEILDEIDAMLVFVTDKKTKFSSNKIFDAICRGKPVFVGISKNTDANFNEIPGVVAFNISDSHEISNIFEKLSNFRNESHVVDAMRDYCKQLYDNQRENMFIFLKKILE